jgi:hypothetical protein
VRMSTQQLDQHGAGAATHIHYQVFSPASRSTRPRMSWLAAGRPGRFG